MIQVKNIDFPPPIPKTSIGYSTAFLPVENFPSSPCFFGMLLIVWMYRFRALLIWSFIVWLTHCRLNRLSHVRLSLLTMTNPNQVCDVLLFVCSEMADETNLSSKLPVADRTRQV